MPQYKKVLSGYVNDSKNGPGRYLTITNMSEEKIVLEPGAKLFLNETPQDVLDKNPNVPKFSKSIKIEDDAEYEAPTPSSTKEAEEFSSGPDDSDDVPF